jgi:hypothetical protein
MRVCSLFSFQFFLEITQRIYYEDEDEDEDDDLRVIPSTDFQKIEIV